MKLRPRNNNLIVKRYERPEESEGGIIIPESFRHDPNKLLWEVVEVGLGVINKCNRYNKCECLHGDIVQSESPWVAYALEKPFEGLYILNEDNVTHIVWRDE